MGVIRICPRVIKVNPFTVSTEQIKNPWGGFDSSDSQSTVLLSVPVSCLYGSWWINKTKNPLLISPCTWDPVKGGGPDTDIMKQWTLMLEGLI